MDFKSFRQIYKLLSKNKRLSEKRHPMFERNKITKIMTYIMIAFWACYLLFFGVMFGNGFDDESKEGCDFLNQGILFFLMLDFLVRFGMQETPAQEVKPYKLLPIPTNTIMNIFLIKIGLNWGNLFWMFFFVPFGFLSIAMHSYFGFFAYIGYLLAIWILFVANSYWYLFWRTFINHHIVYFVIPILIYVGIILYDIFGEGLIFDWSMKFMRSCMEWNVLSFISLLLIIAVLFHVNRYFQKKFIYFEIAKVEKIAKVKSSEMGFLNRYGVIGEYLKLEIKSIKRNNVVRKMFTTAVIITLLFCGLCAFTEAYDRGFMHVFIIIYCFAIFGLMSLSNIMGVEGNYIDGLMSRKESVLALLKAKYYFTSVLLLIPALFMIAPICTGKYNVYEVVGCLLFTPGCIFPCLFSLAIFNNTTVNLTQKMTQRANNTKAQFFISMLVMFAPMAIMYGLSIFGSIVCGVVMSLLGLIGIALHPMWLKVIYKQFMNRRYENMSSFRATRSA